MSAPVEILYWIENTRTAKRARYIQAVYLREERDRQCERDLLIDRDSDVDERQASCGIYILLQCHLVTS